jgi:hypothetical protein
MSLAVYVLVGMVLITSGLLFLDWLLERHEIIRPRFCMPMRAY